MKVLLTGDNEFAITQEKNRLTAGFLSDNDVIGLERIDAESVETSALRDALLQIPFLVDKKCIVITSAFSSKEVQELLVSLFDDIPESTDLICVQQNADKRTKLYKLFQSCGMLHEFPQLKGTALSDWVVSYAKQQRSDISTVDARYLLQRVGNNQATLAREIEKMSYREVIIRSQIDSQTDKVLDGTIFDLLDAALAGNKNRSLLLLDELYAQKIDPSEIISLIGWQLNVLAQVMYASRELGENSSRVASACSLHPFVVTKALGALKRINDQNLKDIISKTLEADAQIKTSSASAEDTIRVLVLEITFLK